MKLRKILSLLLACLLVTALAACAAEPQADSIQVVLDWTPNTNHTGLYAALDLGYYEEHGLVVDIIQPPEDGALALVAAGKAAFGVDFQESLGPALTADAPLPVTAVAAIVSHNTSGIVSLREAGIESPKDLEGKRFAAWGTPLVDAIMAQVLAADGGDIAQVEMLPNAVTDVVSALQADVDAVWIFEAWDGVAVTLSGLDASYMAFADLDPVFDFYTPILVANNGFLEQHPDEARQFLDATARGYAYAAEHPDEAAAILLNHAPEIGAKMAVASQRLLSPMYQADAPYWGHIDEARWSAFYGWMYGQDLLPRDLGAEGFTNDYLPR